jgi:hypothetical protein
MDAVVDWVEARARLPRDRDGWPWQRRYQAATRPTTRPRPVTRPTTRSSPGRTSGWCGPCTSPPATSLTTDRVPRLLRRPRRRRPPVLRPARRRARHPLGSAARTAGHDRALRARRGSAHCPPERPGMRNARAPTSCRDRGAAAARLGCWAAIASRSRRRTTACALTPRSSPPEVDDALGCPGSGV